MEAKSSRFESATAPAEDGQLLLSPIKRMRTRLACRRSFETATANTVLITLIATSRVAFSMGRDGEIARVFAGVLKGRQTPWVAAILTFAMAATLLPASSVQILAEMSSFAAPGIPLGQRGSPRASSVELGLTQLPFDVYMQGYFECKK